ncbi:MAG: hypothetical protein U0232_00140 [Thermomicrobiales bacterium]
MHLFFATSSLSHLPLGQACSELACLGRAGVERGLIAAWGLQLCGGHRPLAPCGGGALRAEVEALLGDDGALRVHHAFSWLDVAAPVWTHDGRLVPPLDLPAAPRTIHPPRHDAPETWVAEARRAVQAGEIEAVEVMYRGYALHSRAALAGWDLPIAVDVSHLHLWPDRSDPELWTFFRQMDLREVHVSHNEGRADDHRPLRPDTFGLAWAAERGRAGVPVVLECVMRGMPVEYRLRQLELLADA